MSRRQRRERRRTRRGNATRPRVAHARLATGAGISLAAALGAPASAQAADFTVTTLGDPAPDPAPGSCDPGDCSLREAVLDANANATDDRILFQAGLTGAIALGGGKGELFVDKPLEMLGPGAAALTVTADAGSRIFRIDTDPNDPVTISGLTLSGGDVPGPFGCGGAIRNYDAELTVRDSTISDNGTAFGGGVYSGTGTITIEGSTISGNKAITGGSNGGGVYSRVDTTIEDSTISGNEAITGGGVFLRGTTTIENSTISGNEAGGRGGGVYSYNSPTDPTLANTIVAANTAPTGPDLSPGFGSDEFDAAFSLIGSTAGATVNETVAGSNITGQSPQLGPLADNGGPTETRMPAITSPAVDRGFTLGPTDQRGLTRPVDLPGIPNSGNGADIGAVEFQLPSNAFTLGALTRKRKKGTATLAVEVPGAGSLVLGGAKVKGQTKTPTGAGVVKLLIRAKGGAAKRLRRTGKARVRAKLTFMPTAGNPATKSRVVRLVKRKRQ